MTDTKLSQERVIDHAATLRAFLSRPEIDPRELPTLIAAATWVLIELDRLRAQEAPTADALREQVRVLREALIAHREDLHGFSTHPCPTCRQSAKALGIEDRVPNCCASALSDKKALAATKGDADAE